MPPGEMQIDRRLLEVTMTQQHLDGAQVSSSFEQMGGKAVTQGVGMDVLVFKPSALCGALAGCPKNLGRDRITGRVPSVAGKQPVDRLASQPAPIAAQCLKELGAEHDIAVLATLASPDVNDHALAVDIADLQTSYFGTTCASGIECHQQDAMKGEFGRIDQPRDLFLAEYLRKMKHLLGIGRLCDAPASLQYVDIEEAQRSQPQDHGVGAELQLSEEHRLILANVLRAKLIGPAAEVPAEVLHPVEVRADGCIGEVAASQLLQHALT